MDGMAIPDNEFSLSSLKAFAMLEISRTNADRMPCLLQSDVKKLSFSVVERFLVFSHFNSSLSL